MPEGIHMPSPLSTCSALPAIKFFMTVLNNDHGSSSSSTSFSSSPAPSSSRTSLHIDTARMHKTSSAPRRIRFAPLLDPRRAVVVTDDGHELPIKDDTHFPAATSLAVLGSGSLASQTQKQVITSSSEQSTPASPSTSSGFSSPSDLHTPSSTRYSPRPLSRSFTVDILKPFKRPGSTNKQRTRNSKSLSIPPEEILTLGTTNSLRSSSLSSDQDSSKEINDPVLTSSPHRNSWVGGWGISRWTGSTPSSSNNARTETEVLAKNPPLTRSQSVQDAGSNHKKRSSIAAFFSATPGVSSLAELRSKSKSRSSTTKASHSMPTTPSISGTSSPASGSTITNGRSATPTRTSALPSSHRTPRHKGARMLNGRIYGAKPNNRISENPFANARDDEPEFVEWGYGGMGSVKGARSAGVVGDNGRGAVNWERLLGGSEVTGQGGNSGWMVPGGGRGGAGARRKQQEKEGSRERRSGETDGERGGDDGEEDDGSGLAWIRKRRKMKEEKERRMKANDNAHEQAPGSESIPASPSSVCPQVADSSTQTTIKASVHDRDQSHPGSRKTGPNAADEHRQDQNTGTANMNNNHHDHVMKAVSVPMSRPKLSSHHRRTSSRSGVPENVENDATAATSTNHDNGKRVDVSQQELLARPAGSDSSSVSESSEEDFSDGEDSSEEDQDEDEKRRTAIGAGVEKVTASFRHRGD